MPVTGLTEPRLDRLTLGNHRRRPGEISEGPEGIPTGGFRVRETLFSLSTLLRPPGARRRLCLRGRPWADSYRPVVLYPRSPIAEMHLLDWGRGFCERERGDDVNMTSTCKGVGPLGMLSEPYLDR